MAAEQTPGTPAPTETPAPKPAARASLHDRMRDAGWDPSQDEVSPAEPEQAKEEKPAKGKAAPKKTAAKPKEPDPKPEEPTEQEEPKPAAAKPDKKDATAEEKSETEKLGGLGLLKKLAAEQGFVVQDGQVLTKERAEFRVLKQEQRNALARAEKEATDRINEAQKNLEERFKRVEAFEGAIKGRDHQGLAKALGYESWDKLQEDVYAWNADPNYQAMKELKEWKAQQEADAEKAAQERQRAEQQTQRAQAEQKYLGDLSERMKTSQDPLVQAMAEDPLFVRAIFRVQNENWDGRETVTPEQAVRMAAQGASRTLGEEMKTLYERLEKVYGKKPEAEKPPAPKPKITSAPKPGPSVPAARATGRNDRMRAYSERLAEATERDRKAGGVRY